jgi:hypothetical protein
MYEENYQTKDIETKNLEELYENLKKNSELPGKTHGFMYIVRSVDEQENFTDNRCKIGETSKNVNEYIERRMYPRNPYKLKLVGVIRGGEWETIFHIRYRKYHIHHEWFEFIDEMLEFIRLLENKGYRLK